MHPKIWAIIPAAGSGSRFSQHELKQYQMISGQTVLQHTVSHLNQLPLSGYVLAINPHDSVAKTLDFMHSDKLHFCTGGKERVDSVLQALNYLSQMAAPNDFVLVHDAARPCVTFECLDALLNTAQQENCSAILAIPVRDTLKRVEKSNNITETVPRDGLWQAQTPQISKLGLLKSAIETSLQQGIVITDEASALEFIGEKVKVVQGRSDNIKITYPDDLELAQLILKSQK